MSYTPPAGNAADFTWAGQAAFTAPAGNAADLSFAPSVVLGRVAVGSPLGAPAVLGTAGYLTSAWVAAASPLGAVAVLGVVPVAGRVAVAGPLGVVDARGVVPVVGRAAAGSPLGVPVVQARMPVLAMASAPSMLGACGVLAFHDFTTVLGEAVSRYVMDLVTPNGVARVPISSWQATLRAGGSSYVQCVVPAVTDWVTTINAATEFVIYRRAVLPSEQAIEYEMARSPLEQMAFDRGPTNYTGTISGYSTGFAVGDGHPPAALDRTLTGVRSISQSGGMRVRCSVDWLLRPGHRAWVGDTSFIVDYINDYVVRADAYMDVGGSN
ncbi:hypothetical protein [Rhodoferax sp.]|uniref:hypothetical protein n=1 Tax=Rhodoferax sp. TaxID=50421 RepID=UPI00260D9414|nr:hypothetical protein [Rhodoferax sp.]MDD2927063.1 hypothetical protein [Rhodoferax sp.]